MAHEQIWKSGINGPSTLEGCSCGWRVEPSSIIESTRQWSQHEANRKWQEHMEVKATRSDVGIGEVVVDDRFDSEDTIDDVTIQGADAERAALADAIQARMASAKPLTPEEAAAVDAARMMGRASEAAVQVAQGTAAAILTGGDVYKRALLCQLLEAQFISGAAYGTLAACEFAVATWMSKSTSAGDKSSTSADDEP